jgi:hypothetical protein
MERGISFFIFGVELVFKDSKSFDYETSFAFADCKVEQSVALEFFLLADRKVMLFINVNQELVAVILKNFCHEGEFIDSFGRQVLISARSVFL